MAAKESGFVKVLAWVLLVLGGIATVGGALQAALVLTVFSDASSVAAEAGFEGVRGFTFRHSRAIAVATLAFSVATVWAAVGLLRRREWARKLTLFLAMVFVLYLVGAVAFQWVYFKEVVDQVPQGARSFYVNARNGAIVLAVVLGGLTAWVALRLSSPLIRSEFH